MSRVSFQLTFHRSIAVAHPNMSSSTAFQIRDIKLVAMGLLGPLNVNIPVVEMVIRGESNIEQLVNTFKDGQESL